MADSFDNNQEALKATRNVQSKTLEALQRMQKQAAETQDIGHATLQQLEEQDHRMDNTVTATTNLNDNLNKASKLQDRFGFLSMQFGTKRLAQRLVKKEDQFNGITVAKNRKVDAVEAPKFKRRGPRPKKGMNNDDAVETTFGSMDSMDHLLESNKKESQEISHQVDKAELFAAAKRPTKGSHKSKKQGHNKDNKSTTSKHRDEPIPMTEEERMELAEIDADDMAVDAGLDIMAKQLDSLMTISKSMGETAQQQNSKLTKIHSDMDRADLTSKQINQRTKLFTMNRRQKNKERNKFETPMSTQTMAAKMSLGL
ncbi:hypothetical protein IV203_027312 [Nitzschia inconspicua]|uniref:t-SNARE coiled-coil homology domain-containing protein n=1 Tax=Nitzschia inconspicua TaxID=303405 RepID=A0A9K3Q3J2_9STRA|nr:hypothetical protein IV203_027312 [Nitzschia inconspicua]